MPDSTDYPRPDVKIVNVETGVETTQLMSDDDYAVWLANCIAFHNQTLD